MKILLPILLSISLSLALPLNPGNKHDKRSIRSATSTNLEKDIKKIADSKTVVKKHESRVHDKYELKKKTNDLKNPPIEENLKNDEALDESKHNNGDLKNDLFKIIDATRRAKNKDLRNDEFRIRVLDISRPTKAESFNPAQIRIGSPIVDVPEFPIFRASEPLTIRIPYNVANDYHLGHLPYSDLFHPQASPIPEVYDPEHVFDIFTGISSFEPIGISQGLEEFSPIVGTDVIQGLPVLEDFLEEIQISPSDPIQINDEKVDTDSDSITVESLESLGESEAVNESRGFPESRNSSQVVNKTQPEKQLKPTKDTSVSEEPEDK